MEPEGFSFGGEAKPSTNLLDLLEGSALESAEMLLEAANKIQDESVEGNYHLKESHFPDFFFDSQSFIVNSSKPDSVQTSFNKSAHLSSKESVGSASLVLEDTDTQTRTLDLHCFESTSSLSVKPEENDTLKKPMYPKIVESSLGRNRVIEFDGLECRWDKPVPAPSAEESAASRKHRSLHRRQQRMKNNKASTELPSLAANAPHAAKLETEKLATTRVTRSKKKKVAEIKEAGASAWRRLGGTLRESSDSPNSQASSLTNLARMKEPGSGSSIIGSLIHKSAKKG